MVKRLKLVGLSEDGNHRYATFDPPGESKRVHLPVMDFEGLTIGTEYLVKLEPIKAR